MSKEYNNRWEKSLLHPAVTHGEWEKRQDRAKEEKQAENKPVDSNTTFSVLWDDDGVAFIYRTNVAVELGLLDKVKKCFTFDSFADANRFLMYGR